MKLNLKEEVALLSSMVENISRMCDATVAELVDATEVIGKAKAAAVEVADSMERVAEECYPSALSEAVDKEHAAYLRGRSDAFTIAVDRIRQEILREIRHPNAACVPAC